MILSFKFAEVAESPAYRHQFDKLDTVSTARTYICEVSNNNSNNLHLIYKGRLLEDEKLLLDYDISEDEPVFVVKENDLLTGERLKDATSALQSVGFSEPEVRLALAFNCNNLQRALEFLTSKPDKTDMDLLIKMASNPQFEIVRNKISKSETERRLFLDQIKQTNPPLHNAIHSNFDKFLQILEDPVFEAQAPEGHRGTPYFLSTQQHDAVKQLMELGFDESFCVQTFLACDEDIQLAAQMLLQEK